MEEIKIKLGKDDYQKILAHCERGLPNEACGLLAGTVEDNIKTVGRVYLLNNVDAGNEHFSMNPKEQIAAFKDARSYGFHIIGNFHSHPESPPRPSGEDKRLAFDSSMEYLILSLQERENPVLKAFGIGEDKHVAMHEIEIV